MITKNEAVNIVNKTVEEKNKVKTEQYKNLLANLIKGIEGIIIKTAQKGKREIIVDTGIKWPQSVLDEVRASGFIIAKVAPTEVPGVNFSYIIKW